MDKSQNQHNQKDPHDNSRFKQLQLSLLVLSVLMQHSSDAGVNALARLWIMTLRMSLSWYQVIILRPLQHEETFCRSRGNNILGKKYSIFTRDHNKLRRDIQRNIYAFLWILMRNPCYRQASLYNLTRSSRVNYLTLQNWFIGWFLMDSLSFQFILFLTICLIIVNDFEVKNFFYFNLIVFNVLFCWIRILHDSNC